MPKEMIKVGIIQTSLDYNVAWHNNGNGWEDNIRISLYEEMRAKKEIRHYLASLYGLEESKKPDIILLSELATPLGYENQLKKAAEALGSIIIAGLDYKIDPDSGKPTVSNKAIIIVPRKLRGQKISNRTEVRRIGKTYPAPAEKEKLDGIGVKFKSHPEIWLFESQHIGKFAIAICYDFMDLDRMAAYRGRIQTLFILAYNRDIISFDHIAESISRTVFCNVVICNCGYYGGSLAVSPYRESHKRVIYRHSGANLTNTQVVEIPLKDLDDHQKRQIKDQKLFKSLPPGFVEQKNGV